ncbi:fluoride efflux transporter FluC [uncultured Amnibacterium sp.]|uniref:fluoride efflux transporter FluC n=1 Tax=uncultured Amnibacterium sp. TaxID=1631851 RepID=UPI0035CC1447
MTASARERAAHLRPSMLAVVATGGAVGTAAREGLSLAIPPLGGLPIAILLINVAGAFVLGLLLEALVRRGADVGGRRLLRLGIGSGFCGGFTTYSTLAVGAAELLRSGATGVAVGYAVGSVLLGAVAAWAGVAAAAALPGRRA